MELSVIIIGLNEGPFLSRCLSSVKKMDYPFEKMELIYVDSSSNDDSITRAHEFGAKVLQIQDMEPSAALARNLGWQIAKGKYILFLDGDTILHPDFVRCALPYFDNSDIGALSGIIREKHPEKSIYNRVLDLDWNPEIGVSEYCGGNALILREVLEQVGGYNTSLTAGEEPEMCHRIRKKGFSIHQLSIPMVLHDLDMLSFFYYWKRCMRTGYAYASISHLTRKDPRPLWIIESHHNLIKTSTFFLLVFFSLYFWIAFYSMLPFYILLAITFALIARTTFRSRKEGNGWSTALPYGIHSHFQHLPMFFGQLSYWIFPEKELI